MYCITGGVVSSCFVDLTFFSAALRFYYSSANTYNYNRNCKFCPLQITAQNEIVLNSRYNNNPCLDLAIQDKNGKRKKKSVVLCDSGTQFVIYMTGDPMNSTPFLLCQVKSVNGKWCLSNFPLFSWGKSVIFLSHPHPHVCLVFKIKREKAKEK